jgi:hypothetical protein
MTTQSTGNVTGATAYQLGGKLSTTTTGVTPKMYSTAQQRGKLRATQSKGKDTVSGAMREATLPTMRTEEKRGNEKATPAPKFYYDRKAQQQDTLVTNWTKKNNRERARSAEFEQTQDTQGPTKVREYLADTAQPT